MKSIGVRELRQHASRYLREVEAGRSLEVRARGRSVALLIPVRGTDHVEKLRRRGRVTAPTGDALTLGPPLRPVAGKPRPSTALSRARARER